METANLLSCTIKLNSAKRCTKLERFTVILLEKTPSGQCINSLNKVICPDAKLPKNARFKADKIKLFFKFNFLRFLIIVKSEGKIFFIKL